MSEFTPQWDNENYPFVYKDVSVTDFVIPEYQRERSTRERVVQQIELNYWAPAVGTLIANSRQDGTIVLLDGHGRWKGITEALAIEAKNGKINYNGVIRDIPNALPTQMFMNMTRHDEILLFQILNRDRKAINEWGLFHAELQEPGACQAKNIQALVKQNGLAVTAVSTAKSLRASPILRSAYESGVLGRVLAVMNDAWRNPDGTYPDGVTSQVVFGGLTRFLRDARNQNKERFTNDGDETLVEKLEAKRLSSILDAVKKEARGGAAEQIAFAHQVQAIWNKGRTVGGRNWYELSTQQFHSSERVTK